MHATPDAILDFWFHELKPAQWWRADPLLDAQIRARFAATHAAAAACELAAWRATPRGRLAEVIVLDQFSRNLFRGNARAFACDGQALVLAQEAVRQQADAALSAQERAFLYLPYMHSESALIHEAALALYQAHAPQSNLDAELKHKAIIDRFGRYPHRNAALGRESTPDELAFLQQPGSSF